MYRLYKYCLVSALMLCFSFCLTGQTRNRCSSQEKTRLSEIVAFLSKTENTDVETREEYNELLFWFLAHEPLNSIRAISELSSSGFAQILTEILNPVNDNIDITLALNSIRECTTKYDAIREVLVEALSIVLSKSSQDQGGALVLD